jgi:predicted O-methyltransferase YrrM
MSMPAALRRVAEQTKGFMPPEEGLALYEAAAQAAPNGVIVEIGSYCGKSAVYIGAAAKAHGGTVVTIDHHRGSEENQAGWEHHDPETVDRGSNRMNTLPFLRRTLEQADLEEHVVAIVGRSATVARFWRTPLAMLFIDGGHSEHEAQGDYESWAPHVQPGGLLVIHDVFPNPGDGGQAPFHVYERALAGQAFKETGVTGSLRVLQRIGDGV